MRGQSFPKSCDNKHRRYAVVVSRFNDTVVEQLLQHVLDEMQSQGVDSDSIDVISVPGAYEIPSTIHLLAQKKEYGAYIALGVLIRGETYHFECIADYVASSIGQLATSLQTPVIFGVLTTNTVQQAFNRVKQGKDYALNAIEMADLFEKLKEKLDKVKA